MDNCKIVADLLPSYCDELTSQETGAYIRTHLSTCPDCQRLLDKMQQRQNSREDDLRKENFRAALRVYERRHRLRQTLILLILLLLVAVFFSVRAFSFDIAIAASGLDRQQLSVVQEPVTGADGKVFQIVFSRTREDCGALACLTKNALGFWTVSGIEIASTDRWNHGVAQITWVEPLFSLYDGQPDITSVCHTIYAGRNAIASFDDIPYDSIPGNVTVMATQYASDYYIHVITVLPNGGTSYDILPLLKENGLIS